MTSKNKSAKRSKREPGVRVKKEQKYTSFKLQKKLKNYKGKVLSVSQVAGRTWGLLRDNKWYFLRHALVFIVLYTFFVRGLGQVVDLASTRDSLVEGGQASRFGLTVGFTLIADLFTETGATNDEVTALYRILLFLFMSMSTFWLVRAVKAKTSRIRTADPYYFGPAQVVPFLLVLVSISIQMIPFALANAVFSTAINNGLVDSNADGLSVAVIVFALAFLSIFLVASSVFGLIVATIPGTRPIQAIKSSATIVRHRRLNIMRHALIAALLIAVVSIVILLPVVLLATAVADYVFYVYTAGLFIFIHAYIYELYLELIE